MKILETKFIFMLDSNVRKRMVEMFLFFLAILYLSSCTSFRSAEGLNGGEVNITYIVPLAGAVRVGVTDNIEARAMVIGQGYRTDIFLHTKNDSGKFNFGITLGSQFVAEKRPLYYTEFIVSNRTWRFNKYLSLGYFPTYKVASRKVITFGSEIDIYKSKTSSKKIIVTPEFYVIIPPVKSKLLNTPVGGSFGLGYTFNFLNLFR